MSPATITVSTLWSCRKRRLMAICCIATHGRGFLVKLVAAQLLAPLDYENRQACHCCVEARHTACVYLLTDSIAKRFCCRIAHRIYCAIGRQWKRKRYRGFSLVLPKSRTLEHYQRVFFTIL